MVNKSPLITLLAESGNNKTQISFLNGEIYIFYFYVNDYDGNIYINLHDSADNPIVSDRRVVLSKSLFPETYLKGVISVEGSEPNLNTIDNICNIFYTYRT
jgi:hypothetical protein